MGYEGAYILHGDGGCSLVPQCDHPHTVAHQDQIHAHFIRHPKYRNEREREAETERERLFGTWRWGYHMR